MNNLEFNLGDKVYHKSDSSIIWVIENIENEEAYCSTLDIVTKKIQKEKFALLTLGKINDNGNGGIITGNSKNPHRW